MLILVLHGTTNRTTFEVENHKPIALVNVQNLGSDAYLSCEEAYVKTQNIEGSWSYPYEGNDQDREGIVVLEPLHVDQDGNTWGHRSTMVGDRMIVLKNNIPHEVYQVDTHGFKRI